MDIVLHNESYGFSVGVYRENESFSWQKHFYNWNISNEFVNVYWMERVLLLQRQTAQVSFMNVNTDRTDRFLQTHKKLYIFLIIT